MRSEAKAGSLHRLRGRGEPDGRAAAGTVDRLERLAALHDRGALTDEEYEAEKALLLT